ncbi:MAG: PAS domain-containing protein [Undibacterium sp.]|nr:PAS domain-containing protein [Undibacterium sp.]
MNSNIESILARLRDEFIARLPERLAVLDAQWTALARGKREAIAALHGAAHSLMGAAGVHRLMGVSDAARTVEQIVAALPSSSDVAADQLDTLRVAITRLAKAAANPGANLVLPPVGLATSPRIMAVVDDADQALWLRSVLEPAGYQVDIFVELATFLAACQDSKPPAAVIMDMVFPEGDDAGAQTIADLKANCLGQTPVIFLSVRSDIESKLLAYRAGATSYLAKPVESGSLLRVLAETVVLVPTQPYRVLLMDDDPIQLMVHAQFLRQAGMTVLETDNPLQVPDLLKNFSADALVLDMYMPQCSGPELAAILRDDKQHAETPIIYLSAETDVSRQLLALGRGADYFLDKPVDSLHLVAVVALHARRFRQAQEVAASMRAVLYERDRHQQAVNAHAIVSVADSAGNITYVNNKFCEVSGYSEDELLGQNHRILKSGEHPPAFYDDMWHTISGGDIWSGEVCNRRKDGQSYWVESSIVPFVDAGGLPYQYISIRTDINQLKLHEKVLRTSEERLRRGQAYANIGTWDWNIETGELFWSERIAPLFGHAQGTLDTTYENFVNAIHPDDRSTVLDAINACIERDTPYQIEHRVVWPDGTVRWLLERGAVTRDVSGKASHMLGVVQDIHSSKQAELALAESEKRLQEAQSMARLGHWEAVIESGELYWSEEIFHIFGRDPATFKPSVEAFQAAVHPDDRTLVSDSERRSEQTGIHDVMHRIVRPDGTVRYVHELAHADRSAEGKILRLSGTVQDTTEFMQAKEQLRQSEERFAFAVEGAGDGIWDWNMGTGEMPLSGHYEAMLGYNKGELTPTVDAWVASVHPDDIARVQQNLQDYLEGMLPVYVVELRLRCEDGGYKWILCRGTVVARDGEGKPERMIGIHSDIGKQKEAQAELEVARESAERANQAKSDFLSSMSHELRTPMNAIIGFAQMLEYDSTLNPDQLENVEEILKGGRYLLELINEVLDLAKIEAGRVDLSLESVDLADLIEDCRQMIMPLATARRLVFDLDISQGAAVRADRFRLKQALLNLLSNAVKYNREAGSICLSAHPVDGARLRIAVADTGAGILAERIAELFLPFNRLDAQYSEVEGTGIGLTITRQLVELMGGTVGVDSQVGAGTTFWIELPSETLTETYSRAEVTSAGGTPLADSHTREHLILCIDDNPVNLKLIAQMLGTRRHIHLITAHTPQLGIELALARRPELILLDINMPSMNGYQVLEIFKANKSLQAIPVIAVTANALARDIERGRAAGFTKYLTKPLDLGEFLKIIDAHLSYRPIDTN